MPDNTRETLIDELVEADSPEDVLLVEMKFDAAKRAQQ
jgi:hypothetical protein